MEIDLEQISSHITDSHEVVDVADVGGVPGLDLLLREHLYHLILSVR